MVLAPKTCHVGNKKNQQRKVRQREKLNHLGEARITLRGGRSFDVDGFLADIQKGGEG
jgi:hypothetical protein